jgi:sensor domain CHASE-containing protein
LGRFDDVSKVADDGTGRLCGVVVVVVGVGQGMRFRSRVYPETDSRVRFFGASIKAFGECHKMNTIKKR